MPKRDRLMRLIVAKKREDPNEVVGTLTITRQEMELIAYHRSWRQSGEKRRLRVRIGLVITLLLLLIIAMVSTAPYGSLIEWTFSSICFLFLFSWYIYTGVWYNRMRERLRSEALSEINDRLR